jgi:hypothetical protein
MKEANTSKKQESDGDQRDMAIPGMIPFIFSAPAAIVSLPHIFSVLDGVMSLFGCLLNANQHRGVHRRPSGGESWFFTADWV